MVAIALKDVFHGFVKLTVWALVKMAGGYVDSKGFVGSGHEISDGTGGTLVEGLSTDKFGKSKDRKYLLVQCLR